MIIGLGMDLVELSRIESSISKYENRFLERILSTEELNTLPEKQKLTYTAGRFAAKEACVKALGTGFSDGVSFQDITITNNNAGAPQLSLTGKAAEIASALGVKNIHITITHTEKTAAAVVIFEK